MNAALTARKNAIMSSATSATLVASLLGIESMVRDADLSTARRLLIEELEARYPEVNAAMDAWSMDLSDDAPSYVEALVAALPMSAVSA